MLDNLLMNEGIEPLDINGYLQEEFTHSAVANAILAGKADVVNWPPKVGQVY